MTVFDTEPLRRAVNNVAACGASTDTTLPILCTVQLEWDGTQLKTVATDRYVLAEQTVTVDQPDGSDPWAVNVDAKTLVAALKAAGKHPQVTFEPADGHVVIEWAAGSAKPPTVDGDYPKVDQLWPEPGDGVTYIGVDPQMLARFAKLKSTDRRIAVRFTFGDGPAKPILVTSPEIPDFRALLAPLRLIEEPHA